MGHEPNAILAISSTDRYINNTNVSNVIGANGQVVSQTNNNQPVSDTLRQQFYAGLPYSNDFQITAPNALINGYIEKIIVSQIQLQYNVPTIIPGQNDQLIFSVSDFVGQPQNQWETYFITIPYGYYTPSELAAILEVQINNQYLTSGQAPPNSEGFVVQYSLNNYIDGAYQWFPGFNIQWNVNNPVGTDTTFRFVEPAGAVVPDIVYKAYKLFGFTFLNTFATSIMSSSTAPQFLYTPYIDILSDALTNYQNLKDSDSSTIRKKGLVARLYLSGVGNPQATTQTTTTATFNTTSPGFNTNFTTYDTNDVEVSRSEGNTFINSTINFSTESNALGSHPFVLTFDLNSPKVIQWSRETAINSLDFQMRDCYGDLLFSGFTVTENASSTFYPFNTEFQMTLLCVEG